LDDVASMITGRPEDAQRRRGARIRDQEERMAEDFSRGGEGQGPREEYRDPWSASSAAAPPACLMRPAAVGVLGRVLSAGDPGLRAGALILLGLIAKEGTR